MKKGDKVLTTCGSCGRRFFILWGSLKAACPHCGHTTIQKGANTR